jgi:GWxTD domain-containing protein
MKKNALHTVYWILCSWSVIGLISLSARAQPTGRPGMEERSQFVYYEAVNLVADDLAFSRIDVLYRIKADFFVAVKNNDPTFPWEFHRRGEVLIELFDSTNVSRAREISHFDLGATSTSEEPGHIDWQQGGASFTVLPGTYRLVLEATDLESERRFLDRNRLVRASDFRDSSLQLSTPLFVAYDDSTKLPGRIVPQNYGGNLPFRRRSAMFLEIMSRDTFGGPPRVTYSLAALREKGEPAETSVSDTLEHPPTVHRPSLALTTADSSIAYAVDSTHATGYVAVLIPLHTDQLPLRPLDLQVTVEQGSQRAVTSAAPLMVWPEMPASLRDIDYALEALRYITTDRERDSLTQGSYETRRRHLEEFWKRKSLSVHRDYRELMTEYYLRVDHAAKEYATLREPDGSKTDRGKTFILHGPPTRVERTLSPTAGFQEVWLYEKLQLQFVFADKGKSGDYLLVSTSKL